MKLIRNKTLLNKISFIDGLPGSGKGLIGPLISATKKNDLWLLNHNYEYLIYLYSIKKISLDAAKLLLNIWADKDIYDLQIGRNINFRPSDLSSVFKNYYSEIIKKRFLLKKISIKKKNLLIMTHNLFFLRKKFNKIFPKFEFICMLRHPCFIIKQFNINSWESRYIKDPKELSITYSYKKKIYPWFLNKKKNFNLYDSFVDFVCDYTLSVIKEKKVKKIFFEKLIDNPIKVLNKNKFNKFKSIKNAYFLFKKFNLPRNQRHDVKKSDITKVLNNIKTISLKNKFLRICNNYESIIR